MIAQVQFGGETVGAVPHRFEVIVGPDGRVHLKSTYWKKGRLVPAIVRVEAGAVAETRQSVKSLTPRDISRAVRGLPDGAYFVARRQIRTETWVDVAAFPTPPPDLRDAQTGEYLREASAAEEAASIEAARHDGGSGVIEVDGRACYVI